MKREDVKKQIPGITDEQLNWIMQANGEDINREKSAAAALQTQLDNANAQLKTAILGKKGRSVKAVRALLDVDALKGSTDRSTDIAKALDDAAKANPWAFGEDGAAGVAVVSTGAEHGAPPANESDGVEAAFKSLNPELNL